LALGNPSNGHGSKLELVISNTETEGGVVRTDADRLDPSRWVHIAVTINPEAEGLLSGQSEVIFYVDSAVKAIGTIPSPKLQQRDKHLFGKSLTGRPSFPGILDDIRVWNVVRTATQIKQSIFNEISATSGSSSASAGLLLSIPFNVTAGVDVKVLGQAPATLIELMLQAQTGSIPSVPLIDLANATGQSQSAVAPSLNCESTACYVPVPSRRDRVLCGDGRRFPDLEECDTGGDLEGCTEECKVRPGYLCSGGEGLKSPDTCVRGTVIFQDGFEEEQDAQSWGWATESATDDRTAMGRASWSTAPEFKSGGESGLRLRIDARELHEGCEPLLDMVGTTFISGQQPSQDSSSAVQFVSAGTSSSGPSKYTAVVSWPITSSSALAALSVDPPRSGYVLQLGPSATLSSAATTYYAIGPKPGLFNLKDSLQAPAGAISLRFRVSALALVQPNQYNTGFEYDGERDLLDFILRDQNGNPIATKRLTPTHAAFPSRPGRWERIILDVEVSGGPT